MASLQYVHEDEPPGLTLMHMQGYRFHIEMDFGLAVFSFAGIDELLKYQTN